MDSVGRHMDPQARLYEFRFPAAARRKKDALWRVLCRAYFQRWIGAQDVVLDVGCGFGEFLNHIRCGRRIGVDTNPQSRTCLEPGIEFQVSGADRLDFLPDAAVDVVFCSNVLEHMPDKKTVDAVLAEVWRTLRPGGRFIVMGPNIRYLSGAYWDFWDHHVAITDRALVEALHASGFEIERCIPRFLPFSTRGALPQAPWLVRLYLAIPAVWRIMGRQFLVIGRRPA